MLAIKVQRGTNKIKINGTTFKPYEVGSLPPSFAFIYNEDDENFGTTKWFNYKGLTYIKE
jgi:hypothetical protein